MATILVTTWDGAGNFAPERALVCALVGRGHQVHVLAHDTQKSDVLRDGAAFERYADVTQIDAGAPGIDAKVFDEVFFAEGIGASLEGVIDRVKPDVLLVDEGLMTALGVAQRSGIATASLGSTLHSFIQRTPLQAPNEACRLLLKFSYREFEPAADVPSHAVYVGPLRPTADNRTPWRRRQPERPLVVASLSTSHQEQEAVLQRLCDVLGDMNVEALVTTGRGVDPASLTTKDNITALRHVAHEAVIGETDLLITHAGHGTVMVGMTHGVPMLCLPMGRDQPLIARRVAELGLGSVLDPGVPGEALKAAVASLLSDKTVRHRSQAFSRQVAGKTRPDYAAGLVEGLLIPA